MAVHKRRGRRGPLWLWAIGIAAALWLANVGYDLALLAVAEWKGSPRFPISPETTVLTEPKTADGYVDFVAAIEAETSAGVTPENNAAALFYQVLPLNELPPGPREEFFAKLGAPPPPEEESRRLISYWWWRLENAPDGLATASDEVEAAQQRPWTPAEFPELKLWLDQVESPLEVVVAASHRPKYYRPIVLDPDEPPTLDSAMVPDAASLEYIGEALAARAMLRVAQKQHLLARDDLMTIHRWARLVGQGFEVGDGLRARSLERVAAVGVAALAYHAELPTETWRQCRAEFAAATPSTDIADRIARAECYAFVDYVATLARAPMPPESVRGRPLSRSWELIDSVRGIRHRIDFEAILRETIPLYEQLAEAARVAADDPAALASAEAAIDSYKHRAHLVREQARASLPAKKFWQSDATGPLRDQLISTALGLLPLILEDDRVRAHRAMAETALALAEYRSIHGEYPASAAELAAESKQPLPIDTYSGEPIRFRRTEEGIVIYSVGPNGQDDNGFTEDDYAPDGQYYDDLAFEHPPRTPLREPETPDDE